MADVKFYEGLLRKFENDETINVITIDVKDACEKGNNFVSNVQRLQIKGLKKSQGYATSLITKTVSDSVLAKKFNFDVIFKNEVYAYQQILPELQKCSKSSLNIPRCLYVDDNIIVLEDISNAGYANLERDQKFTLEQCEAVLLELSKLHAASITLHETDKGLEEKLTNLIVDIHIQEGSQTRTELRTQLTRIIKLFENLETCLENQNIIGKLRELEPTFFAQLCEMLTRDRKIRVFNHGDAWCNNILFRNGNACLIDFQLMRYTSVAADLSYFMYINIKPSLRVDNINKLLHKYLEFLKYYTKENGSCTELTVEWLQDEMKEFSLFGFFSAIWILPVFYMKPEDLDVNKLGDIGNLLAINEQYKTALIEYVKEFFENR